MFHRGVLLALTSITTLGMAPWAWGQDGNRPPGPSQLAQVEELTIPTQTPSTPTPSEDVRMLQERLLQLGYYGGDMDGIFNPETREALADFQQEAGLARTGILDPLTRQQLGLPAPSGAPDLPDGGDITAPDPTEAAPSPFADLLTEEPAATDAEAAAASTPEALAASAPEDVASTPADATASTPDEAQADDGAEAQPAEPEGGRRWLMGVALVGLVIALLGSIGGAVLLILSRRPDAVETLDTLDGELGPVAVSDRDLAPHDMDPLDGPVMVAPNPVQPVAPLPPTPSNPEPQNGNRHPASPIQDQFPQVTPSAPPPTPNPIAPLATTPPPSRLSKVNILDELVQDLNSSDPTTRRKAIWELGQRGNSTAAQPLVTLMMAADSKERSLILAALAEISTRTLKPMNRALQLSLQDENPEVRKNAIRDLTRIYDLMGQASQLLGYASNDEDADVRQTAAWAMEQFNRLRLSATDSDPPTLRGTPPYSSDAFPQDTSHGGGGHFS